MKYVGGKINVKILAMILCVVCAVGVMVGVVFVLKNAVDDETVREDIASEELWDSYGNSYRTNVEADNILKQDLSKAEDVQNMYQSLINKFLEEDAVSLAERYLSDGVDKLLQYGLKQEALELLLSVNYSLMWELEVCLAYFDIISLAYDLNENELAAKYEDIIDEYDDGFGNQCSTSENINRLYSIKLARRGGGL